jgi:hypothetical protein
VTARVKAGAAVADRDSQAARKAAAIKIVEGGPHDKAQPGGSIKRLVK